MMEGRAFCHGAATIVNGIATGKGASFGIALRTEAIVRMCEDPNFYSVSIGSDPAEAPDLAIECLREVLRRTGNEGRYGARIETVSDIPISRGLKSSSAAANAIVLACYAALNEECSDEEAILAGIEASFKAGVTITGAFDDACACYLGGAVVTDNLKMTILRRYPIDEHLAVLVHVPEDKIRKSEVDVGRLKGLEQAIRAAHDLALSGDHRGGMIINGLCYAAAMGLDPSIAVRALHAGALAAGITGTGPATVILCDPSRSDAIIGSIGTGRMIRTVPSHTKAAIIR